MHRTTTLFLALLLSACPSDEITPEPLGPTASVESGPPSVEASDPFALADLSEALPEQPEPPTPLSGPPALSREAIPHHDPRFHDHYQEAMILRDEGEPGAAIDALRLALFDAPDSGVVWLALGESYLALQRTTQGIECVTQALAHDRDLVDAHEILAEHHLDQGEPRAARRHADRLVGLQPESAHAHLLQARSFLGLSMWREAIDAARRTIARDPQQVHAYNALGFAALQVGRDGLALQYLEAATELPGLRAHMVNNLGIAYERSDRPLDALEAYARAARMRPGYTTAVANRDRVREVVDREIADDVARILADRVGEEGSGQAARTTPPVDEATP